MERKVGIPGYGRNLDWGEPATEGADEFPDAFVPGAMVVVTLNTPREKFWGAILAINPAGLSIRGVGLNSFDDFIRQVNAGESAMANVVFFPMHRIERLEIDARNFDIPSLAEGFEAKTGRKVTAMLGPQRLGGAQGPPAKSGPAGRKHKTPEPEPGERDLK